MSWRKRNDFFELAVCGAIVNDGEVEKICLNKIMHSTSDVCKKSCKKHVDSTICEYNEDFANDMPVSGGGKYTGPLVYHAGWFVRVPKCSHEGCHFKSEPNKTLCKEHLDEVGRQEKGEKREKQEKEEGELEEEESEPIKKRGRVFQNAEIREIMVEVLHAEIAPLRDEIRRIGRIVDDSITPYEQGQRSGQVTYNVYHTKKEMEHVATEVARLSRRVVDLDRDVEAVLKAVKTPSATEPRVRYQSDMKPQPIMVAPDPQQQLLGLLTALRHQQQPK